MIRRHEIRAGDLRHRVDLQQTTVTKNELGEPVDTWADRHSNIPASVSERTASEIIEGGRVVSRTLVDVIVRDRTFSRRDRVVWQGRNLTINGARKLGHQDQWLLLECEVDE